MISPLLYILSFIPNPAYSQSKDTHVIEGIDGQKFVFKDTPPHIKFLTNFPLNTINETIDTEDINLEFWVYTSINDAELGIVEKLELSSLYMGNMIDNPLEEGFIGDNCWHSIELTGTVMFVRNNVLVIVSPKIYGQFDRKSIEDRTRKIDSILVTEEKVDDVESIPAPKISGIKLIYKEFRTTKNLITVKIDAEDPNGQKLFYKQYHATNTMISENGELRMLVDGETFIGNDTILGKVNILVWNEDHLVSSLLYEIPFQ